MKKKINLHFLLIAVLSIFLTMVSTTLIYYRQFRSEMFVNLRSFADMMADTGMIPEFQEKDYQGSRNMIRVTLIDKKGDVTYDSFADAESLGNHKNRPEVKLAMKSGSGRSVRQSETMDRNIFYYAEKTRSGNIIRVAEESSSIIAIFKRTIPVSLSIGLIILVLILVLSRHLTSSFVKPIEDVARNLDHLDKVDTYKELTPFFEIIKKQHEDIMKGARMRQDFTANVSHELKTPLTAISGYAELIQNGMASKKDIPRFAGQIYASSRRLLTLINDIIELSELDSSTSEDINPGPVNLYSKAEHCVDMMENSADSHDVTLSLSGEKQIVMADADLTDELIYNLCDNAIRYNKPGGHVWLEVHDHSLTVRDDGIGIPEKYQKRVFERFFRVDKSRSKETGGTGLGLAIVKHIVEVNNAEISLSSEPGKGTAITVIFRS